MTAADGIPFHKMTGSGNDFVVFGPSAGSFAELENPKTIRLICARGTGVGADGVVFLEPTSADTVGMRYYNADGSRASLCGNASLCSTRLAIETGMIHSKELTLDTDAGLLKARLRDGLPEIDLQPVTTVRPDASDLGKQGNEERLGYALVGVPHVIVEVADLEEIDLPGRGSALRNHASLPNGANVNFVAKGPAGWAYRTYERGVEGETLACGSGAVATAILLASWGQAGDKTTLKTRSGLPLTVTVRRSGETWIPSLRGEGRIVYHGILRDLA
jgi:diaminopimelate epimerase